jgi:hypothetical protein
LLPDVGVLSSKKQLRLLKRVEGTPKITMERSILGLGLDCFPR